MNKKIVPRYSAFACVCVCVCGCVCVCLCICLFLRYTCVCVGFSAWLGLHMRFCFSTNLPQCFEIVRKPRLTRDIKIMNCTTNVLKPSRVSPTNAMLQKALSSHARSWVLRKLTKCLSSDQEGSRIPQCLCGNN